jgi:SAM-dependent methyltransferase
MKITHCRYCGSTLKEILSLGNIPLVNYFPKSSEVKKEKKYPLTFVLCESCGLAQIDYIVPSKDIFTKYHYTTGASQPLVEQLSALAIWAVKQFHLTSKHRVLDIGSNDGTLLSYFAPKKIGILGIEPSSMLARLARDRGIPCVNAFFTTQTAGRIKAQWGQFDAIFATHVLANIVDLRDFLGGIVHLMAPGGVFVVEVGYVGDMLKKGQFDAIYHEHYSYFSLASLKRIFHDNGLSLVDVSYPQAQGGSLRVVAKRTAEVKKQITVRERISLAHYRAFASSAHTFRRALQEMMKSYKGKIVVGFGAPAKSVTLLSYCGLGKGDISYIVDSTKAKQGRVLPGLHIPIKKEETLRKHHIDVIIVLAWNYQKEIIAKLQTRIPRNIPVIVPFPKLVTLRVPTKSL